jgi:hypothetical protein
MPVTEGLQMAVACCAYLWPRDEQLARGMRSQIMLDYNLSQPVWDLAVRQIAEYTSRQTDSTAAVEQFLCVGFETGAVV